MSKQPICERIGHGWRFNALSLGHNELMQKDVNSSTLANELHLLYSDKKIFHTINHLGLMDVYNMVSSKIHNKNSSTFQALFKVMPLNFKHSEKQRADRMSVKFYQTQQIILFKQLYEISIPDGF